MTVRPVQLGKTERQSFAKIDEVLEIPNLIEIQKKSYRWFIEEGLQEVFDDVSAITDYTDSLVLTFTGHTIENNAKFSVAECKERDASYAAPLRVRVRLFNKESCEIKEQDIFMGDFPLMTETGTFIINGAERVIVSQVVRSPGIYYQQSRDKTGKRLFSATIIPNRGAWLEFETDVNDVFYVRIDKNRKIPVTVLLRALGAGSDIELLEMFGEDERLLATIDKDATKNQDDALIEVYKRLRPGEPPTRESAETLLHNMFFDMRRYDISKVGRYKYNRKLNLIYRITNHVLARAVADPMTGELLFEQGVLLTRAMAEEIDAAGVNTVYLNVEDKEVKVFSNGMVDASRFVDFDLAEIGIRERVRFSVLQEILEMDLSEEDLKREFAARKNDLVPRNVIVDDIFASVNYLHCLAHGVGVTDDIDHLGNRRLRCVGELLQNQFRIGFARMERVIRERMTIQDLDVVTPQAMINIRPVVAAVKEFFGSSPLSQFMDQINPLAELTHKRRLSALGPGGLSRDRAGFEVRDVHYTHYGRMCPIETPEGPNIGLISYLATYARINEYGFIEAPYRRVDHEKQTVTDEIVYMTADIEDEYIVAQANEPLDDNHWFIRKKVNARFKEELIEINREEADYMDVSPKMMVSVATAMIPFLENDDANRALMGSNMQRQAVPLLIPEAPIVGTGMEYKAAVDSGVCILAKENGTITRVSADEITVRYATIGEVTHKLSKFIRSNQGTCVNQRPIVDVGQQVEAGEIIADGPSTDQGEIALGKNVLIGFMSWEGYNYEDAVLLNERLVREDVYTSIHIKEYEIEARETKLGAEEITRDIPNVGEDALKDLNEHGIIRVGAEVRAGDILVGKVTPKGETELTAEERLLRAIFGEKAREVRDTSLRVPHGDSGIIVDVKVFSRENGDDLSPGVNMVVRCYIAQKRRISVGDKMAGRHGNKGVVSCILPQEDMPFMEDGTPLDIVLNPLGVPSRMNIGQVLEVHLGFAAKKLGWKIMTPVFDGANELDIEECLVKAGYDRSGKSVLYDGRTGEPFDNKVSVGYMYYLKLAHLVDDKIHARSTGPYSLVTQQPLGGKAQFGGQRFGEMEVWALEAYGAAYTLQEILTVKSDDVMGRVKTYEAIVKGQNVPTPGVPESFKVLIKEMQSLGLDVKVLGDQKQELELRDSYDDIDTEQSADIGEGVVVESEISGSYTISDYNEVSDLEQSDDSDDPDDYASDEDPIDDAE